MLTALLAFLGGVTAVALKGWIDYGLEARREQKALRAAVRLIATELGGASDYLRTVLGPPEDISFGWWPKLSSPFGTSTWDEHRHLLAANASAVDWRLVRQAYSSMVLLDATYKRETADGERKPLSDRDVTMVEVHGDVIDVAHRVLDQMERESLTFDDIVRVSRLIRHPRRVLREWRIRAEGRTVETPPGPPEA
jgi:hypothetical protein